MMITYPKEIPKKIPIMIQSMVIRKETILVLMTMMITVRHGLPAVSTMTNLDVPATLIQYKTLPMMMTEIVP